MGITLEPWKYEGQPYDTNSAEMCSDVSTIAICISIKMANCIPF